jgi:aerobic-type carbon monoxide dehydrogenase small subunit (CoxS/CutS family)
MTAFTLNGKPVTAKSEADTPLLWVIRDELKPASACAICRSHRHGYKRF